jgi:hypothetical protein
VALAQRWGLKSAATVPPALEVGFIMMPPMMQFKSQTAIRRLEPVPFFGAQSCRRLNRSASRVEPVRLRALAQRKGHLTQQAGASKAGRAAARGL